MGVSTADDASWETIANNIKSISKGYSYFKFSNNSYGGNIGSLSSSGSGSVGPSGTIYISNGSATGYGMPGINKITFTFY